MSLETKPEDALTPEQKTPEVDASERPAEAMPETPSKVKMAAPPKGAVPTRPPPQTIMTEVTEIIREKFTEAGKQLQPAISVEVLSKVVEAEAKRRTTAILQDAVRYARNRAKTEKVTPRFLAEAALDYLGIKRESRRADKSAKKSTPNFDMKGGDHGSK